jgi:hypothetical protein
MQFDPSSHVSNSNSEIIAHGFTKLMSHLCENVAIPSALLKYEEKMTRILPQIPVSVLKQQYKLLKDGRCGARPFLDLVASLSPQTDDTVEFMIDLIVSGDEGINKEIFTNFMWTATLMPTMENE